MQRWHDTVSSTVYDFVDPSLPAACRGMSMDCGHDQLLLQLCKADHVRLKLPGGSPLKLDTCEAASGPGCTTMALHLSLVNHLRTSAAQFWVRVDGVTTIARLMTGRPYTAAASVFISIMARQSYANASTYQST